MKRTKAFIIFPRFGASDLGFYQLQLTAGVYLRFRFGESRPTVPWSGSGFLEVGAGDLRITYDRGGRRDGFAGF